MIRHLLICAALLVSLSGCSESESKNPSTNSSGSSRTSDASLDLDSGEPNQKEAAPDAPMLNQLMKMAEALHVMWTNPETGCDSIEGERKATMAGGSVHEEYAVVFTVPGEVDNKHDSTATADMDYTYRLRCKKGDKYSPYSNEMTANPTK